MRKFKLAVLGTDNDVQEFEQGGTLDETKVEIENILDLGAAVVRATSTPRDEAHNLQTVCVRAGLYVVTFTWRGLGCVLVAEEQK